MNDLTFPSAIYVLLFLTWKLPGFAEQDRTGASGSPLDSGDRPPVGILQAVK